MAVAGLIRTLACGSLIALSACTTDPVVQCARGETRQRVAQMLFGRNIGDRLGVSEDAFRGFLDSEIVPRFPDGLTVVGTEGRWRDGAKIVSEPGKLVIIALPGRADDQARLGQIASAYERRFRQQAVLTITASACTALWPAAADAH